MNSQAIELSLIYPNSTDKEVWDALVNVHKGKPFSYSKYLDAVCKQWVIIYTVNKTAGISIPLANKFGKKIPMIPLFWRSSEWIGSDFTLELKTAVNEMLRKEFSFGFWNYDGVLDSSENKSYQVLSLGEFSHSTLAKRMIKKSYEFVIKDSENYKDSLRFVKQSLRNKVPEIVSFSPEIIELLSIDNQYLRFHCFNLYFRNEQSLVGSAFFIETTADLLYLKGTCSDEAKDKGGMYRLIQHGIELAKAKKINFDFGGSSVKNVRDFNLRFGASDQFYTTQSYYVPFWYKLIRRIR